MVYHTKGLVVLTPLRLLHSSETEDDYDISALTFLSSEARSEASKEMLWLNPSLEMEVCPYRIEPDLPPYTDRDIEERAH